MGAISRFLRNEWFYLLLGALIVASLVPLIVIAVYSRPCLDDFSYGAEAYHYIQSGDWNILGLLKTAINVDVNYYQTWQGLYTSAFVLALQPGIFGAEFYCIGTWLLLILSFFSLVYFIKTIFKVLKIEKLHWFLAIFLFAFLMQHMPDINQALYWFNGAWNYIPFFFLVLVNIAMCCKYIFLEQKSRYIVLACILSFVISGGNHVTSFMNILLLACICGYSVFKDKKKWKILLPLAFAVLGFIIMYVAPGTAVRQEYFQKQGIISTIYHSFKKSLTFTDEYCSKDCFFYILSIFIIALFTFKKENFSKSSFRLSPILIIVTAWIIMCGMLAAPYYAMGTFGEARLWDVVWMFEICSIAVFVFYSTWYVMFKYVKSHSMSRDTFLRVTLAVSVLVGIFWIDGNYYEITQELKNGQSAAFAQAFDERENVVKSADSEPVVVAPLPESKALRFADITDDVTHWRNEYWESYYGVKTITR